MLLQSLISLARVPDTDRGPWLEGADQGVRFLTENRKKDKEIVLYASGPHLLVHSVLVPRAAVDPPDHDDLAQAYIMREDTWCIQRSYGGGEGHRVYLEPPPQLSWLPNARWRRKVGVSTQLRGRESIPTDHRD